MKNVKHHTFPLADIPSPYLLSRMLQEQSLNTLSAVKLNYEEKGYFVWKFVGKCVTLQQKSENDIKRNENQIVFYSCNTLRYGICSKGTARFMIG